MTDTQTSSSSAGSKSTSKGLAEGTVGTSSAAVLGIASVAPGYTLTASIGLIVAAIGLKMPAGFIGGFLPMFLTVFAYRELNADSPDAGASFTWSTRAFGPYVGWMCGWGMVIATIIVLSNLAAIAADFFYLLIAALLDKPWIATLTGKAPVDIATTLVFVAVAAWVASRGIQTSQRLQWVLVGFQLTTLLTFAVVAITAASRGHGVANLSFRLDWFLPFGGPAMSAFVVGVTGSIFGYWGWDTPLTLGEESKDPTKVPGGAALLCVVTVLLTYLLVGSAMMMYAGVGTRGLGLGNEDNTDNEFRALAQPVLGHWGSLVLFLAILAASAASLQTTFLPAARCMLAMGGRRAFPKRFADVHPRLQVPVFGTVVAAVATGVLYTVVRSLSARSLLDTVSALGILICWYYGITAFACLWYFRGVLFKNLRNGLFKFLLPLLGGVMLLSVFVISVRDSIGADNGSGASIAGIGLVFYLSFGILLLGFALMLLMRVRQPEFFRVPNTDADPDRRR